MYTSIQNYLRFAASDGRKAVQVGPFLTTINESWDNPYVNYAIPNDACNPTAQDVADLIAHYRTHNRIPRLEFIPEIAPQVQPILLEQGFVIENTHPLMVASTISEPVPCPDGFAWQQVQTRDHAAALTAAQHEAYNLGAPENAVVENAWNMLQRGSFAISAIEVASGQCAGGGVCTKPRNGATELAGVGVRSQYRRRSLGEAITKALLHECTKHSVQHPFLMAGGADEARMYQRAGFKEVGHVLCMRLA